MKQKRSWTLPILASLLLLVPGAAWAQEEQPEERPEPGFRVLGPRTVVSFVRQTLHAPGVTPVDGAGWSTLIHVTNTGNAPMDAAAIFVAADGETRALRHFGIRPGRTRSFTVARIVDLDTASLIPDGETEALVRGVVLLRFFGPLNAPDNAHWSQMVSAEQILHAADGRPVMVNYLDVERPQNLVRRALRR